MGHNILTIQYLPLGVNYIVPMEHRAVGWTPVASDHATQLAERKASIHPYIDMVFDVLDKELRRSHGCSLGERHRHNDRLMFALKAGASRCGRCYGKHQKSPAKGTKHPKCMKLFHKLETTCESSGPAGKIPLRPFQFTAIGQLPYKKSRTVRSESAPSRSAARYEGSPPGSCPRSGARPPFLPALRSPRG